MGMNVYLYRYFFMLCIFVLPAAKSFSQAIKINNHASEKFISFGNKSMNITLDYNKKATITALSVNGEQLLAENGAVYATIKTKEAYWSTLQLLSDPIIQVSNKTVTLSNIVYGDKTVTISETWTFHINADNIKFTADRTLSKPVIAEQVSMPVFVFKNMDTWEGAYQDYGGLAWFYLFNKPLDTYGVYSQSSQFWNSKTGNCLNMAVDAPGKQVSMDYSRTADNKLAYSISIAQQAILPRYDSGTRRRFFIRNGSDVWAPIAIDAGKTSASITLSWSDYTKQFDRGSFTGINGTQVSAVLNTIARIGIIGKQHFGGNSWHTPYGPICLHEQYIAQLGLAINDKKYLEGYSQCLDFYRDDAIKPDGRVWARWAYNNEDIMEGEVTDKGFYEARWGYLLDANPDYVSNVAELYDQTGNLAWVKTQQLSCEKALDWILKRDSNNNGLVEMINDSYTQKKGSDWLDIIWASYENAFVNAKLYHALVLWAAIEKQLGNTSKEKNYTAFAEKLKTNFNKPVAAGGFWDEEKKCYIHWREKDGSAHGNNMVTPVNFMAIAYGICENDDRKKSILDGIELQMQKENLFFWPVCMYSYAAGEANDWQFPFPNYENGDIFLSWGAVAVNAYAAYKPALALQYVKNVLAQYAKDGLAFQRYGRVKQDGLGDDILSGNSLSVVGLYQAIYGINPKYNRFYLNPHITAELAGTRLKYNYRDKQLSIHLDTNKYAVSDGRFTISSKNDFGFFSSGNGLLYFNGNKDTASLKVITATPTKFLLEINDWNANKISWTQSSAGIQSKKIRYELSNLSPGISYNIFVNGKILQLIKTRDDGVLQFEIVAGSKRDEIVIAKLTR